MPREDDYEIGYGRPPEQNRFKPGQSGNPKGRPKGSKNIAIIVSDAMNQSVTIREGGRERKIRALEAMIQVLLKKALGGDDKAMGRLLEFQAHNEAAESVRSEVRRLDSAERQILMDTLREAALDDSIDGSDDDDQGAAP